jgi:hypothetical protein
MLLFVLEGLLALVILLTIVFWTGKGRKDWGLIGQNLR